jgi:hypothetical protein
MCESPYMGLQQRQRLTNRRRCRPSPSPILNMSLYPEAGGSAATLASAQAAELTGSHMTYRRAPHGFHLGARSKPSPEWRRWMQWVRSHTRHPRPKGTKAPGSPVPDRANRSGAQHDKVRIRVRPRTVSRSAGSHRPRARTVRETQRWRPPSGISANWTETRSFPRFGQTSREVMLRSVITARHDRARRSSLEVELMSAAFVQSPPLGTTHRRNGPPCRLRAGGALLYRCSRRRVKSGA